MEECTETQCPKCGKWQEDMDGFGVLFCECGYCAHTARSGGKRELCGEESVEYKMGKSTIEVVTTNEKITGVGIVPVDYGD